MVYLSNWMIWLSIARNAFAVGAGTAPQRSMQFPEAIRRLSAPALLLAALALFAAAPAEAQTVTLVSNFGQEKTSGTRFTGDNSLAQRFTTGANSGGYTLASIEAISRGGGTATQTATTRAELWSATTAGAPDSKLADLTTPSGAVAANATMSFGAPAGTTLTANTNYYFVIYTIGSFDLSLESTSADDEDSGGLSGWTIENALRLQARTDTPSAASWATDSQGISVLIRVKGAAQQNTADANLRGLTASDSTSASGTFAALTLSPAFAADTTSYTATVLNARTHLKLTPTVNDSSATVKVGKQGTTLATVTSGQPSAAIELSVGSNAITVEVTAADTTTTKTYTVTVRRVPSGSVWAATLNANDMSAFGFGCTNTFLSGANRCDVETTFTDDDFSVGSNSHTLDGVQLFSEGTLRLSFSVGTAATYQSSLNSLNFCVGATALAFSSSSASGGVNVRQWASTGLTWTVGTPVSLSIGTSCAQQTMTPTQSTDATLSGLTATSSTSASGTFTALSIGTFAAGTTSYTATVANDRTHVKLTPTVNDSGATVTVQGTTVTSGSASSAIALSVGSNALSVVVTAQDTTTTRTYTVTITRQQSSNANLSGLAASDSTSASGTFTALTLTPAFSATTTSYTATVANPRTHAKITPTVAHSAATVTVGGVSVTSGTASAAFALSVGNTARTVRVTAQDGTTKDYTVTITRQAQAALPAVRLSASPNPVTEGSPVTVTALLSAAVSGGVTIPLTITDNTAESGDHGPLASISIASGATSGTGTITTNQDADTDNEIFTVALNTAILPSTVTAGTPSSVQITINDDDAPPVETPTDPPPDTPTDGGPAGTEQVEREPEPLQLALWTDRPGYRAGETVRLYHTLDPHDDDGRYRTFLYLEQAGGGQRRYLSPLQGGGQLHADAVDRYGLREDTAVARILAHADRVLSWEGEAPAPGQWHFVLELRPGEPSQRDGQPDSPSPTTRRAWAKFTVAERTILLNRRGFDREIRSDATLRSDTLYYLGHQLFVHDGATLTLQRGTVLLAFGRHAAIIVEPGGRIVAEGTRQAPVVLTCSAPLDQREPGCWGGLRILGKAPVTRLEGVAPGVLPAERAAYGGSDADGSSGLLRYVRVEFAGASGEEPEAVGPAIGLYGAGSATLLDHVQARHSLGPGFAFSGGSARCDHCVASSSGSAGLAWDRGWRGSAAHLYVQHGPQGLHGLDGGNDEQGHDREPRSLPTLSNVTLVHSQPYGRRARRAAGLHLRTGSGLRARDLLASHFGGGGVQAGPRASMLFTEGESSLAGALLYLNGAGRGQLRGLGLRDALEYIARNPDLRDVRYFANPDPRPKPDSPALADEGEGYIGAFGRKDNWLEEWTVFGPESVYDPRERSEDEN